MHETLDRFRQPKVSGILADLLCDLIIDIRRILIHPELPNHAKLAAIAAAVDGLAPPPQPDEAAAGTWRVPDPRPGPS
jgi:hypothetical protein